MTDPKIDKPHSPTSPVTESAKIAAVTVRIVGDIDPAERRAVYQKPLSDALRRAGLGRVSGSGRVFAALDEETEQEDETHPPSDRFFALDFIELDLAAPVKALPLVLDHLRRSSAARLGAEAVTLEITESSGAVRLAPVTRMI